MRKLLLLIVITLGCGACQLTLPPPPPDPPTFPSTVYVGAWTFCPDENTPDFAPMLSVSVTNLTGKAILLSTTQHPEITQNVPDGDTAYIQSNEAITPTVDSIAGDEVPVGDC